MATRKAHDSRLHCLIHHPKAKSDLTDSLKFWLAYGNRGEGGSLKLTIPLSRLRKVLYGAKSVTSSVERIQQNLVPALDALESLASIGWIKRILADAVWKNLAKVQYLFKSEAYRYERECRIVVTDLEIDSQEIVFQVEERNGSLARVRHYVEDKALLTRNILATGSCITLGPCVPNPENVAFYFEVLKERAELFGYPEVKISKIPYRGS